MRALWATREERVGDQLHFAFSRQFKRNAMEKCLKGCNELTNLLGLPYILIHTCDLMGVF